MVTAGFRKGSEVSHRSCWFHLQPDRSVATGSVWPCVHIGLFLCFAINILRGWRIRHQLRELLPGADMCPFWVDRMMYFMFYSSTPTGVRQKVHVEKCTWTVNPQMYKECSKMEAHSFQICLLRLQQFWAYKGLKLWLDKESFQCFWRSE